MSDYLPPIDLGGFDGGGAGAFLPSIDLSGSSGPAKQSHSWGSYGKGLLHGIESTVTSIPAIATRAVTHPIAFAEDAVAANYDLVRHAALVPRAFANLAVGDTKDFHKFYDQYRDYFYQDPFANTLLWLGGGNAIGGRIGAVGGLREAGMLGDRAALTRAVVRGHDTGPFVSGGTRTIQVQLGKDLEGVGQIGDSIPTRKLGGSHSNANRAYAVDALLKQLPQDFPLLGEAHRVARATRTEGRVDYLRYLSAPEYVAHQKTTRAMTRNEKAAAGLRNKAPMGTDVETWIGNLELLGTPEADALVRQMRNPKIRALYDTPSNRILANEATGTALAPLRTAIMLKHGALTAEEALASPWRITRQLRGATLATPAWVYKQRRKIDANLRQITGAKGKLVTMAKAFGSKDMREQIKASRLASDEAIKESGYRAKIYETLGTQPRIPNPKRIELDKLKAQLEKEGLPEAEVVRLQSRVAQLEKEIKQENATVASMQVEGAIPEQPIGNIIDIGKEVDASYANKEALREDMGIVMSGQGTAQIFDKYNLTPEGGIGATEAAMHEAVHKAVRREEEKELKADEAMLKRARNRTLNTAELNDLGQRIPSDIRNPTPEELKLATEKRADMEAMASRLKEARRFHLTPEEIARVTTKIEDLRKEILKLENPRHLRRSPSYTKRRFESRYAQAEKKLQKRIATRRLRLEELGTSPGVVENPMEAARIKMMGLMERRYRRSVIRYERAVAAEHAHAASIERGLDAAMAQAKTVEERGRIREAKIKFIQAQRVRLHDLNEAYADQVALRNEIEGSVGQLVGGGSPWELEAEARLAGRPIPYYSPDEMLTGREAKRLGAAEGSILPQRPGGDIYKSRSILMRTGLLALHPDTLSPAYFRAAKHDLNVTMHGIATRLATRISRDEPLPKGYEYLRRTPGETISETAKHKGEHLRALEDQYGREQDISTPDGSDGEIDFTEADGKTYRLIIPKAYANEFRAESLRAQTTVGKIFKQGMDVWRSLVLHLRVPWLVNNVIGNTFLFAMRYAGLSGLTNFARMMASNPLTRKYLPGMERLALQHLTAEQVREIFPEQVRGTHFETQAPGEIQLPGRLGRMVNEPLGATRRGVVTHQTISGIPRVLPRVDKAVERRLRRAATNQVLRSSPQVKTIYKEMKRQGSGSFHDAVTKAIEDDPHFRGWVVQEVNDSLGNFLSLSRAERSMLRRVVPFYAWMREITRMAGRMTVDHPGRVLLLTQLAKVTADLHPEDVPSYMSGTVLGEKTGWLRSLLGGEHGGLTTALGLHGMSPYATVGDLGYGAAALLPGSSQYNVSDFAGNFSPAIAGLYGVAAGRGGQGNLLANYAQQLWGSVPQTALITPHPSRIYPDRGRIDLLTKLGLGNPVVHYSPEEASYQRFLGR